QASFALKEMGKGALFATLERTRTDLQSLSEAQDDLVRLVCEGINGLTNTVGALMGDPQYALLNAKRVCEMVIDVVVSAELLFQAEGGNGKRELAASFIHRHIPPVAVNARRIATPDASPPATHRASSATTRSSGPRRPTRDASRVGILRALPQAGGSSGAFGLEPRTHAKARHRPRGGAGGCGVRHPRRLRLGVRVAKV